MTVFFLTLRRAPAPQKGEREREGGGGDRGGQKIRRRKKQNEEKRKEDYVIFSVVSWDLLSNVLLQEEMDVDIFFRSNGGWGRERVRQIKSSMGTLLSRKSCFIPAVAPWLGAY